MKKSMIDIIKNSQPFCIIQFKVLKEGFWHTVQKPNEGDYVFETAQDALIYTEGKDFLSWHPEEWRICAVSIVRYKKQGMVVGS